MATDYLVALTAGFCATYLLRGDAVHAATVLWSLGMICLAIAAFSGGTYHGVGHALGESVRTALWKTTTMAVGAAGSLMLAGTLVGVFISRLPVAALAFVGIELVVYVTWMARHDQYRWVMLDSVGKLVAIAGLAAW